MDNANDTLESTYQELQHPMGYYSLVLSVVSIVRELFVTCKDDRKLKASIFPTKISNFHCMIKNRSEAFRNLQK